MQLAPILAAITLAAAAPSHAQAHADHAAPAGPAATATTTATAATAADASAAAGSDGEVRRIDREQGRITLRHGTIGNLGMPAMTMVFQAASPRMLDSLKPGDKVRFSADKIDGALVVTAIEAVQ